MPGKEFRATRSAAEVAMMESEGYADEGLAEHKGAGGKHLGEHWHKGKGGLRPEEEDAEEEQQRLRELAQKLGAPGMVHRAMGAVGGVLAAVAGAVIPGRFKQSPSAAELAYGEAEGYADAGPAEHKSGKKLEDHWHKGRGGLRSEGEDYEEEEQRLHELEERKANMGVVERAKETVTSAAAAATEKASEMLQAAKEYVGMPKK